MKIESVTLHNFKNCPDGTYPLDHVNVFIGGNGKGKTSLQMAVRFLLTGILPDHAIRAGEDTLSVTGILDDGQRTQIGREVSLPDTFLIDGNPVSDKTFYKKAAEMRKECEKTGQIIFASGASNQFFFEKDPTVLWNFLTTGKVEGYRVSGVKKLEVDFADGSSLCLVKSKPSRCIADGSKVSAKVLDKLIADRMQGDAKALDLVTSSEVMAAMSMPDFAKYLVSMVPVKMGFSKLAEVARLTPEEISVLKPFFPEDPNPISIEDVVKVYKSLCDIRADLRKRMDASRIKMEYEGQLPLPDKDFVLQNLDTYNQALGAAKELEKAWKNYQVRVGERAKIMQNYSLLVKQFNEMGKVPVPDANAMNVLKESENAARASIEQVVRNVASMRQSLIPLKKMLNNLDSSVCPLCDKLVCSTDKTSCKSDIMHDIAQIEKGIQDAERQNIAMQQQLEKILLAKVSQQAAMDSYRKKADLYKQICQMKAAVPAEPKKPDEMVPMEALTKKVQKFQKYLQEISVYAECCKAKEQYMNLSSQYDLYCGLTKKAEPKKGILTNTIMEYLLAPFKVHVNGFIQSVFDDTEITFRVGENGLDVLCRPHGRREFVAVGSLSDGEKMLATFSLMDMVSTISGSRILCFDRMESMDAEAMSSLMKTVLSDKFAGRYDHVILGMVNHSDTKAILDQYKGCVNIIDFQ